MQTKYVMQGGQSLGETFYYPKSVVQVYFKPVNKGKASARVTLYNMLLSPNMFMFELVDDKDNVIDTAGNDL